MSKTPIQIQDDSDNSFLMKFVLERKAEDYTRLYESLTPRLMAALQSKFSSHSEHFHRDIVHDVLTKFHAHPAKAWDPASGKPPQAFFILLTHATNLALDRVKHDKKFSQISLDDISQQEEHELATLPPTEIHGDLPNIEVMDKVLAEAGLKNKATQALLANIKDPVFWKISETAGSKAKLDYERLAEHHKTSVNTMQQRVRRLREAVLKKFTSSAGFMAIAMRTLAWVKQSMPRIAAWSFIVAGLATSFTLLIKSHLNEASVSPSQTFSMVEASSSNTETPFNEAKPILMGTNVLSSAVRSPHGNELANGQTKAPTDSGLITFSIKNVTFDTNDPYIGMDSSTRAKVGHPNKIQIYYVDLDDAKKNQIINSLGKDCEFIQVPEQMQQQMQEQMPNPPNSIRILLGGRMDFYDQQDLWMCIDRVSTSLAGLFPGSFLTLGPLMPGGFSREHLDTSSSLGPDRNNVVEGNKEQTRILRVFIPQGI